MKVTTDSCLFGAWIAEMVKRENIPVSTCLDIGTGTGLLSLMLAQQIAGAAFDAVEIDTAAAAQAKANAAASPWKDRIRIIQGDAKEKPSPAGTNYSIIISNPPFYENELPSPDAKRNIAHHESGLTLNEMLSIIISGALSPDGSFYLLLPFKRITETISLFRQHQLKITHLTFVRPSAQHAPTRFFIEGRHNGSSSDNYTSDEIAIRDADNQYTPAFTRLLKEYYLHL